MSSVVLLSSVDVSSDVLLSPVDVPSSASFDVSSSSDRSGTETQASPSVQCVHVV